MKLLSQIILDNFVIQLTGLTTTANKCRLSKFYTLDAAPSLTILRGPDKVTEHHGVYLDRDFEITVVVTAKKQQESLDDQVSTVLHETYTAITSSNNLGLSFIHEIELVGESELRTSTESDKPTAEIEQTWRVKYRHPIDNPSQ
jgi:hypothetical protein